MANPNTVAFDRWVKTKLRGTLLCPCCRRGDPSDREAGFSVGGLVQAARYAPGMGPTVGDDTGVALEVMCLVCAHLLYFNAAAIGIHP